MKYKNKRTLNEMQPKFLSVIVCDYSFCMYESLIVIISDSVPHESNVSPVIINHSIDYDQCVLFFSHLQWKKKLPLTWKGIRHDNRLFSSLMRARIHTLIHRDNR